MAKTDVFGFFKPTTFTLKKVKITLDYFAFVLIRTELTELDLIIKLYQQFHCLFKVSPHCLLINDNKQHSLNFPVYLDTEDIEQDKFLIIRNNAINNSNYKLIGEKNNSVFSFKEQKRKLTIQQLSIHLEEENNNFFKLDSELERWKEMKRQLKEKSFYFTEKIDFIIPISIYIYEHFLSLLNSLHTISEIKYCYRDASDLEDFDDFYYLISMYKDTIKQKNEQKRKNSIEIIKKNNESFTI